MYQILNIEMVISYRENMNNNTEIVKICSVENMQNVEFYEIDSDTTLSYISGIVTCYNIGLVNTMCVHVDQNIVDVSITFNTKSSVYNYLKSNGFYKKKHINIPNTNLIFVLI